MNTPYQVMPDLTPDEFQALKADIAKRGIQVPVLVDEAGNILDGHHRKRIAEELRVHCPTETRVGLSEANKVGLAVALNINRRHLTRDQKQAVVDKYLTAAPEKSDREIAKATGADHKTVGSRRKAKESVGEIPQPAKRTGKDGKQYQATKPTPQRKAAARQIRKEAEQSRAKAAAPTPTNLAASLSDEEWRRESARRFVEQDADELLELVHVLLVLVERRGVAHGYTRADPKPKASRKRTPKPKAESAAAPAPTDFDELVKSRPAIEVYRTVFGKAPPSSMTDVDMVSASAARYVGQGAAA